MSKTVAAAAGAGRARARAYDPSAFSLYAASGARKYLNAGERTRFLAASSTLEPNRQLFALTLAWTGARISEVLALTAADFQIDSAIVAIRTLKRRRFSIREIPIPPALLRALDVHFRIAHARRDAAISGEPLWRFSRSTGWRIVKTIMNEARITGHPACPRGLRHAFGVGTLQAGVPITLVQRWLGHARLSTTAIYADVSGPEETAFAQRFWRAARPAFNFTVTADHKNGK